MFKSLRQAVNWWIDGVAGAAVAVSDRIRRREENLVARPDGEGGWLLFDAKGASAGTIEKGPSLSGRRILVELHPEQVFRADLQPVPAESREFLAAIVEHRVDRIAPWRHDDRIVGFDAKPSADGQIAIAVAVTAHAFVDPLLAAAAGAREIRIVSVPAQLGDVTISPLKASDPHRSAWRWTATGLAALIGGTAILGVGLAARSVQLSEDIPALQQRIDDRLLVLKKAQAALLPAAAVGDAVAQQKAEAPVSVLLLEVLSRLLPDDTSLTALSLADGQVKISGATSSLSTLIPVLTASPSFSDVAFTDPTERMEDGSDHFSLQLSLRPMSALTPPG